MTENLRCLRKNTTFNALSRDFTKHPKHPDTVNNALWPDSIAKRRGDYFSTYKSLPGEDPVMKIEQVYGCDHALKVIEAALEDYDVEFGR